MISITILAMALGKTSSEIYPLLCDFEKYPQLCDVVRSVKTTTIADNCQHTDWEVNFQNGILRWTEEDVFRPETLTIQFRQLNGDIDCFEGHWSLEDTEEGCRICFTAQLDLGIPSLSDILEPVAEKALMDTIRSILTGLLDGQVEFLPVDLTVRSER